MRFRLGVEQEDGSEEGEPGCIVVRISDEYGWFILGQTTPATQLPIHSNINKVEDSGKKKFVGEFVGGHAGESQGSISEQVR